MIGKADGQVDLRHDDDDDDSFHCHYVYVVNSMVVIECLGPLVYKLQIASVESHFTKRTLIVSCVCILNDLEILNCIFFFKKMDYSNNTHNRIILASSLMIM